MTTCCEVVEKLRAIAGRLASAEDVKAKAATAVEVLGVYLGDAAIIIHPRSDETLEFREDRMAALDAWKKADSDYAAVRQEFAAASKAIAYAFIAEARQGVPNV